jgi:hypothetical protein
VNSEKYIGLDLHQATISVAVLDCSGKVVMESILETKAATILEFLAGLRGTLSVTFEEGTWAAWLYDLLKPHVDELPDFASLAPRVSFPRFFGHSRSLKSIAALASPEVGGVAARGASRGSQQISRMVSWDRTWVYDVPTLPPSSW